MRSLTLEQIKERLVSINENIEVVDKYSKKVGVKKVRNRTFVICKCKKCDNEWDSELNNLLNGYGCMICSGHDKKNIEYVREELKDINPNIEIISDTYINNSTKLKCRCLIDGHEWGSPWTKLQEGKGCPVCGGTKRLTIEGIREKLKEINPNIEIISNVYKNTKTELRCRCLVCNYEWDVTWSQLYKGHGCHVCSLKGRSGENHPRFNPNLTDEEREYGRNIIGESYSNWRNEVFKRDNYTCQCCGYDKGGILNPHHLDGYDWAKDKRVNVDNGITLCEDCHKEFHTMYGYGKNTKEQFEKYLEYKKSLKEAM